MLWRPEEIEYLRANYTNSNISLKEICEKLGRTKRAVCHYTARLGLRRSIKHQPHKINPNRKEYDRKWYKDHKSRVLFLKKQRAHRLKKELVVLLGGKCSNCPENRVACMDFHHKNKDKENTLAYLIHSGYVVNARKEAKKCELLCANCHRVFHWKNNGNVV